MPNIPFLEINTLGLKKLKNESKLQIMQKLIEIKTNGVFYRIFMPLKAFILENLRINELLSNLRN